MVDTLVAFGCSNTYGNEALESGKTTPDNIYHAYPYFLSQMLNIPNYKNYALSGSSNVAIGMKVADFIQSKFLIALINYIITFSLIVILLKNYCFHII